MPDFFKKYRVQLLAGGAILAALVFLSLNLRHRDVTYSFERAVLKVSSPLVSTMARGIGSFRSIWEGYVALTKVREENRRLLQTIKIQNDRLIQGNEAFLENGRLKALLQMKKQLRGVPVAASVIAEEVSPWFRTVMINRGTLDGIREGQPVVALNGVVGQIIKAGETSSRVLLMTDATSAMAATIQRSRARGVLKGKGSDLCSLEFASRQDDIKAGDIIITSGVGGVFPKGIPIGEVTMVKKGEYGIFQTVTVRPAVDLSRLEELLVLVSPPS